MTGMDGSSPTKTERQRFLDSWTLPSGWFAFCPDLVAGDPAPDPIPMDAMTMSQPGNRDRSKPYPVFQFSPESSAPRRNARSQESTGFAVVGRGAVHGRLISP